MKRFSSRPIAVWLTLCLLANGLRVAAAPAGDALKLQAQLIWGTNEDQSSDPKHKAIGPELAAKLKNSAFRWKNYFEINRIVSEIPLTEKKSLKMSEQCQLDIKNLGGDHVEINFFGEGKPLSVHKEKVATDWPLILSGNAKDGNAWMVVIHKIGPAVAGKSDTNATAKPLPATPPPVLKPESPKAN